jgi:hypothetical protein
MEGAVGGLTTMVGVVKRVRGEKPLLDRATAAARCAVAPPRRANLVTMGSLSWGWAEGKKWKQIGYMSPANCNWCWTTADFF